MRVLRGNDEIVRNLRVANWFWTRLKGLLGTRELPEGHGLLIVPCNSVHMLGMKYPIDVVFLSKDLRIVRLIPNLRPWQLLPVVRGAHQVLELPAGTLSRWSLEAGEQLTLEGRA